MKTLAFLLTVFLTSLLAHAQESNGVTITVTIENVLSDEGHVIASLHTVETFMKGPGVINAQEKGKAGELTLTFENVQAGTYAIMAMHDENDNQRMDFEANGMPKESFGMSGNDMTPGPPSFDAAKFEVADSDMEFKIRF